ncbi:protein SIEVE ELEMENT OCCLUSION B-like isoform X2 [Carya illinoinensis]|uniref:Uncharacterized protein n=2 Tax=Carya illinoinensis TaxID=32201 RepID=A0A8T1N8N7_CARIL|nr:protein SIEVE ELEMENT OCCLUSION B-like isoform X2 [Carya illinoinensis]KAG6625404.1 hypothetical protein CIPAW_16G094100 [Carya illinoinensis]KAG6673028.1 hypothetical protein I3842_16G090300 [Carya illinoinensis]
MHAIVRAKFISRHLSQSSLNQRVSKVSRCAVDYSMAAIKEQSIMSAKKNDLMTFNFREMKFEPACTHDPQKADDAKANYWETLSEDQPQVQEIVKAFIALRSAKDNPWTLIDGSTKKEVGVDVLKKKNILLIISGFSKDDISKLNSIYELEATPKKDNYKIVWILMVEQISAWTDEVLDMLQCTIEARPSKKAWYVLPCFSQAASSSQFMMMSKEWQFKNELIMMVLDLKGKDKVTNAFRLIIKPTTEMNASASTNSDEKAQKPRGQTEKSSVIVSSEGPQKRSYEFYYRGTNDAWNDTFLAKANKVGQDVLIIQLGISVKSFKVSSEMDIKRANKRLKDVNHDDTKFSNDTSVSLVVLIEEDKVLKSGHGDKMLGVLERFDEQWKKEVEKKGFARSFMDSYENSR